MSTPEILPQSPVPPEVQHVPQTPEIPAHVEQGTGMQAVPSDPQQLQTLQGQVLAQPTNPTPQTDPNAPTVTIPAHSQEQLVQMSQGNPDDSSTWFGVEWLRRLKQAIHSGIRAIFSQ